MLCVFQFIMTKRAKVNYNLGNSREEHPLHLLDSYCLDICFNFWIDILHGLYVKHKTELNMIKTDIIK